MTPAKTPSWIISLCLLASLPLAAQEKSDTQTLPRYRFEVGQKIVFGGNSTSESSNGTTKSKVTWTIWVTDRTSAGGYQLVLKRSTKQSQYRSAPKLLGFFPSRSRSPTTYGQVPPGRESVCV